MLLSVQLEPLLEKELEQAAVRLGISPSQFIVSALEQALGRKNPYDLLLLKEQAEVSALSESSEPLLPVKATISAKLKAKHEASKADWLAYQNAKKHGQTWSALDQETGTP